EGSDVLPVRPREPEEPRDEDGEDVFRDLEAGLDAPGRLANVAGVKFQEAGAIHEFDAADASFRRGDRVIVESDRGPIPGTVAVPSRRLVALGSLRRILRRAGADDDRQLEKNVR